MSQDHFPDCRSQHTCHSSFDIIDTVINNTIQTDIDTIFFSHGSRIGVRSDVEADNQGFGGRCQHDIGFIDGAYGRMDNGNTDFIALDTLEGLNESFYRSLNIGFDDDIQFLHFPFLDLFKDIVQGDFLYVFLFFFLGSRCAEFGDFSGLSFIHDVEMIACFRHAVHTKDFCRCGRFRIFQFAAVFIGHGTDTAPALACQDSIPHMKGTVLYEYAHDRASALIQLGFYDYPVSFAVRIGFQFLDFCYQKDIFQKVIKADLLLCGNRSHDNVAAPFFAEEAFLGKFFLDTVRVGAGFINFIDSYHDRYARIFCVMNGFYSLGHDSIISSYN